MGLENKGFLELFGEKKAQLDRLQMTMASILPSFPGLPAAKYQDIAIGVDFHATVMPPSPIAPIPHVGMVFDIMGAIISAIASVIPAPNPDPDAPTTVSSVCKAIVHGMKPSVKVNGKWIANAGVGIQHLPGVVIHVGPVVKPMASSEMWMGSSTVLADGGPFSSQFHPALSCNLVGFPSLPRLNKKPKPKMALMAPTSCLTTVIPSGAPVLVGGPPTIDLFQLMFKMGLKGLGKAWKKIGNKFQGLIDKIKPKNPKCARILQKSKCKLFGEPVDAATGRVFASNVDFELPGPIPLVWERTYYSDAEVDGPLGYNWHHSYNLGLYDMGNGFFTLRLSDGRETVLPKLKPGEVFYSRGEQLKWQLGHEGYILTDSEQLLYRFKGPKNSEGYQTLSSISKKDGFSIQFQYNTQGILEKIQDSSHREIQVENDSLGRVLRVYAFGEGEEITFASYCYDAVGNMVKTMDALGNSKHFFYDGHLLIQLTNQSGLSFYWEYQGSGDDAKCVHTWGDGGVLEYWTQYEDGKTITRDSLGHTTEYHYDANHLIHKIIDANGGVTRHLYNDYGELAVLTNPEGLSGKRIYNDWGKPVQIINENEEVTYFSYDDQNNLVGLRSPQGRSLQWEYDKKGRLIKKTGIDGNVIRYKYQGPLLSSIMDGQNREFHLQYNRQYNLTQFSNPTGNQQHWEYDHWGRVTRYTDIKGNDYRYAYDRVGNLTGMIEPDGNEHQITYDAAGNVVMAKDSDHLVNFSYGPLGVLKQREQHGSTVTFSYDTELQLRSIANEGGELYRFGLDALGQVVDEWGFDGMKRSYTRDGTGRVKRVQRPSEKSTRYEYDGIGNIIVEKHQDGAETAFRYDKDGLLLEAVNGDGHILLKRDKAGRVIKEIQGNYEVSKKYDPQGNCIFIESNLGAAIQLGHDEDGLLTTMQASSGHDPWTAQWERDNSGLELHRQMSGGISVHQERDNLGRVMRRSFGVQQEEQSRTMYVWGRNNRLHRTINELSHNQVIYEYDELDSLISAAYTGMNGMETLNRIPDKIGNLFKHLDKKDRIYGKGGKLLECNRYFFHYDTEGNLVFKEFKKNENRNAINKKAYAKEKNIPLKGSSTGWAYEWNSGGTLSSVIHPCGKLTQFWYDSLGRRIAKMHQNKVTRWVWDGNVPLHEWSYHGDYPPKLSIGSDGKVIQEQEPVEDLITWVFEEGTFIPCAKLIGDQKFSIITDYLGTPTHAFDANGIKVWERELDCYGKTRRIAGDASFCPYMYQGQYQDTETGLYYNRFRYYSPEEGMYISQDPIGLAGGKRLYGYVHDPNTWIDVFGLSSECGKLSDEVLVIRGGTNKAEQFTNGSGVTTRIDGKLDGVSVNSKESLSIQELSEGIPNGKVGVTTVGDVRQLGGDVVPSPTIRNPNHATLSGITAEQAESLFNPVIPNPTKK